MERKIQKKETNGKLIFKSIEKIEKTKREKLDELNHLISLAKHADDQEWKEELEQEKSELLKQTEEDQSWSNQTKK